MAQHARYLLNPSRRQVSFSTRPSLLFTLLLAFALLPGCARQDHESGDAVRRELGQALRDRAYEKAAQIALRRIGAHPKENAVWESLVRAQMGLRDFAAAKQTIADWRAVTHASRPKMDELAGDVARKEHDLPQAVTFWSKARAAQPANLRLLNKLAQAHRAQQQWPEEEGTLTAILQLGENPTAQVERALCRRRMHRWAEALDDLRRAHELAPDDPDVRRGAKLLHRLGKVLAEIRELDARLALTPDDDQLLADRALLFLRNEDFELALTDSEAAARKAAWAVRPKLFRAIALVELGRGSECAADGISDRLRLNSFSPEFLETISRLDAEISLERNNAELYVARAWQLNEIEQPTLALKDIASARRYDPRSAGAHAESSYALTKLGRAAEALAEIKLATELDSNFSTAWHYRGELEMAHEDYIAAVDSLSHALAINQTGAALQKREECYVKLGLLQKAEEDHRTRETLESHAKL